MSAPHDDLLALAEALPGWTVGLKVNLQTNLILVSVMDARESGRTVTIFGRPQATLAAACRALLVDLVEDQRDYLSEAEMRAIIALSAPLREVQ